MAQGDGSKPERSGGIQSLERAAAILDAVADCPDGIGLTDLSSQVNLHTSTAFHLIKTLVALGLMLQVPGSKKYRIGSRLFTLAAGAMNESTLLVLGTPVLERLSEQTGEAAHLALRSRKDIILVARTAATGMLQMSERAGIIRPAHATAIGKILIAYLPESGRNRLLDSMTLTRLTENTITDIDKLRVELETVLIEGIAHDRCEFDSEVRCIAMPVRDFSGRCIAAIGISGPKWRMTAKDITRAQHDLASAALDLSRALGHHKTPVAE